MSSSASAYDSLAAATVREHSDQLEEIEDIEEFEDFSMMSGAPEFPQAGAMTPTLSMTETYTDVDWQQDFARALGNSEEAARDNDIHKAHWEADPSTGAGIPSHMLAAEVALERALEAAPMGKAKSEKTAVFALRLYNHAKWLAERNHAMAAEHRYWKAKEHALAARRSVLAGHALSRLGYFLVSWGRREEARSVLEESVRISKKSNPMAPYLLGVLDRQVAGADVHRLHLADDRILFAEVQPSEDLEEQRQKLIGEIEFWRRAETSPWRCIEANDVGHAAICFAMHAAVSLSRALT